MKMARNLTSVLVGGILLAAGPAAADSGKDFFKGKTITYIVSTDAGGGYDAYGRLIAKYMEKHLPVRAIVVKNMPGAGHIIGANHIYNSKPDGLTFGTFNTGLVYAQIVDRKGIKFDLTKFSFLGKAAEDPRTIMVSVKSPLMSFDDLLNTKKQVKFAGAGPGSASFNETTMLINALNLNIKFLTGYNGREDEMAMMRGEMDGGLGSRSSYMSFVNNGYGRFLLQIGGEKMTEYDVPLGRDVVTDPAARSVVALIGSQAELARLTAAPPGLPKDRLAALVTAYREALSDPGLLADAKKMKRPIVPMFGDDVGKRISAALKQSPEMVAMIRTVLDTKPKGPTVTTKLLTVTPDGKNISFAGEGGKAIKSKVSGSRTKIAINGKSDNRKNLSAGMDCTITYAPGDKNEPSVMDCKGVKMASANPCAVAAANPCAAKGLKVSGPLLSVSPDGKKITFASAEGALVKSKVSGSRTKISIGGAAGDRKALVFGMPCEITYAPGDKNEPSMMDCTKVLNASGKLLSVSPDGKKISFKGAGGAEVKGKVSGSRTKIVIAGAAADRKALKAGMACTIAYIPGGKNEPSLMDCK